MKTLSVLFVTMLFVSISHAQSKSQVDALLDAPQTIKLVVSTPQPRMGETFQITLDVRHLRANIFRSLAGKVRLAEQISGGSNDDQLVMNVTPVKKGKNEVGPLTFTLDKTKYTTNKISFDVIDALPNTDEGLWFRKVMLDDSNFCIIIEQRIPATEKRVDTGNRIELSTVPKSPDIVKFKDSYSVNGLNGGNSQSSTNYSSVTINGQDRQFMYGYSIYYFSIADKKGSIRITKDKFENLPNDYKFEDIVVQ